MNEIIVTLKDGRTIVCEEKYIWGYEEKLNDNRTPFMTVGNVIIRKEEVSTIEIVHKLELEEEVETNE